MHTFWREQMSINWFPGHMHKATKAIRQLLPKMDLIVEILDARMPFSSSNPVIQQFHTDLPRLKLLNKADLADDRQTEAWLHHFGQCDHLKSIKMSALAAGLAEKLPKIMHQCIKSTQKVGGAQVLITGIPNVGKSTIINQMLGRTIAKTGNQPAVTRDLQKIQLSDEITLWDSPGILWPKVLNPKSGLRLAATGAIKDTAISHDEVALFSLDYLLNHYTDRLQARYQVNTALNSVEVMEQIGLQRGCLGKGGQVDFDKVAKLILQDLRSGQLGRVTLETPIMQEQEMEEAAQMALKKAQEKAAKKAARKKAFKKRH